MSPSLLSNHHRTRLAGVFVIVSLSARAHAEPPPAASPASTPLAQSLTGDARADYDSARLLYDDGDFAGASLKFQHAYASSHDARLLWNAGACEKQLRHYARTYLLVSQYLREAGPSLSTADSAEATDLLQKIESFVSHVTVRAEPDGVELAIDDVPVARLPTSEAVVADMGTRRFRFHKAGFHDVVLSREVAGGTPTSLAATLEVDVKEGTLRVLAAPGDQIRVDGRYVGTGEWQGSLGAGAHALNLSAAQKKPYQTDVAIVAGQTTTLRVGLEPLPKAEKSKFLAWPWVAGGLVAVAAIGIGTYFAVAPEKSSTPQAAPGTVSPGYWTLHY